MGVKEGQVLIKSFIVEDEEGIVVGSNVRTLEGLRVGSVEGLRVGSAEG